MKKRMLSILLCLALAIALIPGTALADNTADSSSAPTTAAENSSDSEADSVEPTEKDQTTVEDESTGTSSETSAEKSTEDPETEPSALRTVGVTVTANGITEDVGIDTSVLGDYYSYDASRSVLTILKNGATISGKGNVALKTADSLTSITLKDLTLTPASPVASDINPAYSTSIAFYSKASDLTVLIDGNVTLTGSQGGLSHAGNLTLSGDTLTVTGNNDTGLYNQGILTLQKGLTVNALGACNGIECAGTVDIQSAVVNATGETYEGIYLFSSVVELPLTDSPVSMEARTSAVESSNHLKITGSSVVTATGGTSQNQGYSGISVYGDTNIDLSSGGKMTVTGGSSSNFWFDTSSSVTAGILSSSGIALGDKTGIVTPENGYIDQCTHNPAVSSEAAESSYTVYAPDKTYANVAVFAYTGTESYTVTFDSDGGSNVDSQTVTAGECANKPDDPTKDGTTFQYWANATGEKYDFTTPVTADITLTAIWDASATYTVTFDSDGGTAVDSQTVAAGKCATEPDDPTKDGATFQYWADDLGEAYDFTTPVNADLTLTAVWATSSTTVVDNETDGTTGGTDTGAATYTGATTSSPKTGDQFQLALYIGLVILAAGGLITTIILIRHRKAN